MVYEKQWQSFVQIGKNWKTIKRLSKRSCKRHNAKAFEIKAQILTPDGGKSLEKLPKIGWLRKMSISRSAIADCDKKVMRDKWYLVSGFDTSFQVKIYKKMMYMKVASKKFFRKRALILETGRKVAVMGKKSEIFGRSTVGYIFCEARKISTVSTLYVARKF